jgi:hypothetical protein
VGDLFEQPGPTPTETMVETMEQTDREDADAAHSDEARPGEIASTTAEELPPQLPPPPAGASVVNGRISLGGLRRGGGGGGGGR